MAVFTDALDLRTAVFELIDDTTKSDVFPRWVGMAEDRMNTELRVRNMVKTADLTLVDGLADLPDDFLEIYDVCNGPLYGHTLRHDGSIARYGDYHGLGYTIEGLTFRASGGTYAVRYYASIPTIADDITASNWLLQAAPEAYLYAVAAQGLKRDPEQMAFAEAGYRRAINRLKKADARALYGSATVAMAGATP